MTLVIDDIYGLLAVIIIAAVWLCRTLLEWRIQVALSHSKQAQADSIAMQAQMAVMADRKQTADAIGVQASDRKIGF